MTFKVVPVMASVVWNPQVVWNSNFVLQEPKLEALEARGRRQVFPVYTNKHACTQLSQSATLWRSACYIAFWRGVYLKSKKSKAVIVSKTAKWSTNSLKIITTLWMRVLTLSMLRSSRTFRGRANVRGIIADHI